MIKATFDFIGKLIKVHPSSLDRLESFDVMSLFINIQIHFTINLLLEIVFDGKIKDGKFYEMKKQQLKRCSNGQQKTVPQFNGSNYEQTNEVTMETLIAPPLADIVRIEYLTKLQNHVFTPKFFRYKDDCLALSSNHEKKTILSKN